MDTAVRTKEKQSNFPSQPKTTARELGGFFFALIVAACFEFLSWLNSLRSGETSEGATEDSSEQREQVNGLHHPLFQWLLKGRKYMKKGRRATSTREH